MTTNVTQENAFRVSQKKGNGKVRWERIAISRAGQSGKIRRNAKWCDVIGIYKYFSVTGA